MVGTVINDGLLCQCAFWGRVLSCAACVIGRCCGCRGCCRNRSLRKTALRLLCCVLSFGSCLCCQCALRSRFGSCVGRGFIGGLISGLVSSGISGFIGSGRRCNRSLGKFRLLRCVLNCCRRLRCLCSLWSLICSRTGVTGGGRGDIGLRQSPFRLLCCPFVGENHRRAIIESHALLDYVFHS